MVSLAKVPLERHRARILTPRTLLICPGERLLHTRAPGDPTDGEVGEHRDLCNPTQDAQPLFLSCHTYSMKLVTVTLSLWGVVMKVK